MKLKEWIKHLEMTPGLRNSFGLYLRTNPNILVNDISKKSLMSTVGVGIKKWQEFEKLKKQ